MDRNICHMTSTHNLESIFKAGELICKSEIQKRNIGFQDISNHDVQDKRATKQVEIQPGGTLYDYVPFYFWGLTPMLYVNRHRQNEIIFFVSKPKLIKESGQSFVFTDRHAILALANFSNNLCDLDKYLDMSVIKGQWWNNTPENPDRKERKQAEFLVYKKVNLAWCAGIVTLNDMVRSQVESILEANGVSMSVKVYSDWYYI